MNLLPGELILIITKLHAFFNTLVIIYYDHAPTNF